MTLSYKIRVVKKYKLFKKSNENYGIENHNNNIKILLELQSRFDMAEKQQM